MEKATITVALFVSKRSKYFPFSWWVLRSYLPRKEQISTVESTNKTTQNSHIFSGENHENRSFSGAKNDKIASNRAVISIERYRKLTGDNTSSDDVVLRRILFMQRLFRKVIKEELEHYAKNKNASKSNKSFS